MFLRVQADWFIYLEIVYFIIAIAVAVRIIYDTDSISKTLAYLLLVFFVPIFGILFYFSFGINYRRRKMYSKKLKVNDEYSTKLTKRLNDIHLDQRQQGNPIVQRNRSFIKMLSSATMGEGPLLVDNKAEILENGEEFFPRLIEDLKAAKSTIHIEYYIYENNDIGKEIESILINKVKEGLRYVLSTMTLGVKAFERILFAIFVRMGSKPIHLIRLFY